MAEDDLKGSFVLGVDLDGVCADWGSGFRALAERHLGIDEGDLPQANTWEMSEWGLETGKLAELFRVSVHEERLFRHLPIYEHVSEVLQGLSRDGVHIRIVTHRLALSGAHATTVQDTVEWLDEHDIPYWDLCFLGRKSDLHVDLLIDDAPHNIASLRAAGSNVLVMDQPYNVHLGGPRAHNWREVDAHVRKLL
ncbi:MAG: 5'-nucleotidase [Glaciecola sp.]|jgi:5'-nucleotidase